MLSILQRILLLFVSRETTCKTLFIPKKQHQTYQTLNNYIYIQPDYHNLLFHVKQLYFCYHKQYTC